MSNTYNVTVEALKGGDYELNVNIKKNGVRLTSKTLAINSSIAGNSPFGSQALPIELTVVNGSST